MFWTRKKVCAQNGEEKRGEAEGINRLIAEKKPRLLTAIVGKKEKNGGTLLAQSSPPAWKERKTSAASPFKGAHLSNVGIGGKEKGSTTQQEKKGRGTPRSRRPREVGEQRKKKKRKGSRGRSTVPHGWVQCYDSSNCVVLGGKKEGKGGERDQS